MKKASFMTKIMNEKVFYGGELWPRWKVRKHMIKTSKGRLSQDFINYLVFNKKAEK